MASKNTGKKTLKTPKSRTISQNQPAQSAESDSYVSPREDPTSNRQHQIERSRVKFDAFISIAFAIFVGIPAALIAGFKLGLAIGLVPPICFMSYRYPRAALWVFLIYMPFSGTAVYWLAGGNPSFQLAKDVFYVPALIGLVQDCRKKRLPIVVPNSLKITLGILIVTSLITLFTVNGMQEFTPDCGSGDFRIFDSNGLPLVHPDGKPVLRPCRSGQPFLQGILGLKVFLGYVPLIFCGYYLIDNKKQLFHLLRLFVILAIICCSLGLVQFYFLKTGRCVGTRYTTGEDIFSASLGAKCLVGGALLYSPEYGEIRLPGTFVSPWHWSWFLVANAAICFTSAFSEVSFLWRILGITGLVLVQINAIVCGQRLAFLLVPLTILTLVILTGQIANFKKFIPLSIGIALLLFIGLSFLNPGFIQERFDSFVDRWNTASPIAMIFQQFQISMSGNTLNLFGRGLGKATNSARVFGDVTLIETYHPKLFFEVGLPGLLAFLLFTSHLTFLAFKSAWQLRDRYLASVGKSLAIFVLIISYFPYWYPLDTDPVSVYYWLLAGIIFRLPFIERQATTTVIETVATSKNKSLKVARKSRLEPI